MPLAENTCRECGKSLRIGDFPFCPHESIYAQRAQRFDPVVIHRDAAGNVRFPGATDAAVPPGFEKVELRTLAEVRQFERSMDARERARFESGQARESEFYAERQRRDRAELREAMRRMSPYGRQFAEVAMQENDRRNAGRKTSYDPNFHVECFSFDSSNREAHRDERTGWQPRKG